jgi:5-methylcytosine-specific restriction endonuclease McrA
VVNKCGTYAGYSVHITAKEKPCDACTQAAREYQNSWNDRNREKKRLYAREWNKKHKEYRRKLKRENSRKRRAQKKNTEFEKYTESEVLEKYGSQCHICLMPIDLDAPRSSGKDGWENGLHMDHVLPLSKGGSDTIDNVRPSHGRCNLQKGNK